MGGYLELVFFMFEVMDRFEEEELDLVRDSVSSLLVIFF